MFLKRDSQGKLVRRLQERLNQLGYESGEVDGFFGPKTERAVLRFQQDKKIDADGIVGNQTWQALFAEAIPETVTSLEAPPSEALCLGIFGDFRLAGWAEQNLVRCDLSEWKDALRQVYYETNTEKIKIFEHADWFGFRTHRLVVPKLQLAFKNLAERGLSKDLKTFDGCFNPRLKRGGSTWSVHSWAIAIDVNAVWNAFGQKDFEMPEEFAVCFEDVGFIWGGRWSKPDAMHFQYCLDR